MHHFFLTRSISILNRKVKGYISPFNLIYLVIFSQLTNYKQCRLFCEIDRDANKSITLVELENLINVMQSGKIEVDKHYAISKILTAFDLNHDTKIDEDEFVEGCKKWIEEAKMLATSDDSSTRRILHEVI